jgi:hypothetical protein
VLQTRALSARRHQRQLAGHTPARTPDGQPDIQGMWNPIGTFYNIQDLGFQARYQNFRDDPTQRGKSLIIDPPDGKIPYQPWALEKVNQVLEHHADPTPQFLDPNARCFMQGVPRHLNNREFEIFQPPGYVVVSQHGAPHVSSDPSNGGPHIPEPIKLWMGDSRGRWTATRWSWTSEQQRSTVVRRRRPVPQRCHARGGTLRPHQRRYDRATPPSSPIQRCTRDRGR